MEPYQELELKWAEFNKLDPRNMVVCSSGTAALHLALECLGLAFYSGVLVPDFTMIACARACTLASLLPVFVDCGDDLLINPQLIDQLDRSVKAVMSVHIYGRQCDMEQIHCKASRHDLRVVEDLAEAHGIPPHPDTDAACWSFYKNKVVAGEEGGAVYFKNAAHAAKARSLRSLGFTGQHDFTHIPRGHNYRLSNTHAELVLNSLDLYQHNIEMRLEMEALYDRCCPAQYRMPPRVVPWVYDFRVKGMTNTLQDEVVNTLKLNGIEARHAFKPMSRQMEYSVYGCIPTDYLVSNAHKASMEVIYLPLKGVNATRDLYAKRAFEVIAQLVKH